MAMIASVVAVKRMGRSFAVFKCGASRLLAPRRSDMCASQHLAPHRITSSPALIAGVTPDPLVLIRGLRTVVTLRIDRRSSKINCTHAIQRRGRPVCLRNHSVGADLCVCPGVIRRTLPEAGAPTQVCPYAGLRYLFKDHTSVPLLVAPDLESLRAVLAALRPIGYSAISARSSSFPRGERGCCRTIASVARHSAQERQ